MKREPQIGEMDGEEQTREQGQKDGSRKDRGARRSRLGGRHSRGPLLNYFTGGLLRFQLDLTEGRLILRNVLSQNVGQSLGLLRA